MPIDQASIANMLAQCVDANNVGRKVYFCEGGNLMTAMDYFRRITGERFDLTGGRTATFSSQAGPVNSFKFNTYSEQIGGVRVSVTLRGGSSSMVATERYVMTSGRDSGLPSYTHDLPGVPTMEFQNASALLNVAAFLGLGATIVEIKFTTRYEFTATRNSYTSH